MKPIDVLRTVDRALSGTTTPEAQHDLFRAAKRVQIIETPTGPLSLIRPVAEQLLKSGVISGELDGKLTASDALTVKAAVMNNAGVCDFCSAPGPTRSFDVPDFVMPHGGMSTGGWASCDACGALVDAGKRKELLARTIESMAFSKFTRPALEELHARFWQNMDDAKTVTSIAVSAIAVINGQVPPDVEVEFQDKLREIPTQRRRETIRKELQFSDDEIDLLLKGQTTTSMAKRLLDWKRADKSKLLPEFSKTKPPLADVTPHWQKALDGKFAAHAALKARLIARDAQETLDGELRALRDAQVYSFNVDTIAAIREAAKGIPRDTPLSAIETPHTGAGWFWFVEPLQISARRASVHALLWWWSTEPANQPSIVFSTYRVDENGRCTASIPFSGFSWLFSETCHQMLAVARTVYQRLAAEERGNYGTDDFSEDDTVHAVAELALFFVMACVWFKQTVPVLTREPQHVERHERKRMMKAHKLSEPPKVHVVALRKSARTPSEQAPIERQEGARAYHCRWIVKGHPRLQACGPARKDRKLIWIEPFIKGPDDAPIRTRTTVYAVIR